jgi:ribosomal protein S18 acetylase RimI-like enzyme
MQRTVNAPLVRIERAPADFTDWTTLLELLQRAFAAMESRIDPPSSVLRLTSASLETKSREETLFLARAGKELVGCVFAKLQDSAVYVSKLAVREDRRRDGIARRLMAAAETYARDAGCQHLELDTRIELTENHATFAALGFTKIAERAHDGYERPTFITMRKMLRRTSA